MIDVTVAICTWNRSAMLRQTLERLTSLRVSGDRTWELIVVNNNCTDDTDQVCLAFEGRLPIRIVHEPTPGQSHARNAAIREARGRYLAWTDDDVIVDSEWLEALVQAFERYDAAWVFGSSEPEWPGEPPAWYGPRLRGAFAVLDYGPDPFVVRDLRHPFYGLNFAGTLAAHRALGGFRTEFGFVGKGGGIGEDIDMFERAMRAEMKVVYTPAARVRHIIPQDRVGKSYHRRRQWVATATYYRHLDELFPSVPWLMGVPRFMYGNALRDLVGVLRSAARGNQSDRFHHEQQLLRFIGLATQSAKNGFRRRPSRLASSATRRMPGPVNR
jgi:glucosyl-dolichyl phosphate glucuronosyltransferase